MKSGEGSIIIVSGVLSLAGLLGVLLANMQIRNIGIIGYVVVTLFLFSFLGIVSVRTQPVSENVLEQP